MAGKTLEEYFVSLGIKGQNVVLKNIKNIKKQTADLTKNKAVLNFGKGIAGILAGVTGKAAPAEQTSEQRKEEKIQKENNKKFADGVNKFASGSKNFAVGVAHFDPVRAIQQAVTSGGGAIGAVTAALPGVGNYLKDLPKGLAGITNAIVGMAAGAVDIAKESAAGQYGLSNRNEITKYYGGEGIGQGGMSRAQHSELVMAISGSFGRIQKPFQKTVNKLVESKNTEALARVAGGNWASTGEDRGWLLQQIANETQGLPPTIAQAIQNSLLRSNADLIQGKGEEKGAQGVNAAFMDQKEDQIAQKYKATAANFDSIYSLSKQFNSIEISMIKSGASFAVEVDKAARAIAKLPEVISEVNKALNHAPGFIRNLLGK